jgi:pimeloyl-ACP methyl ester carboxylesterase
MNRNSFLTATFSLALASNDTRTTAPTNGHSQDGQPHESSHDVSRDDVRRAIAANQRIVSPNGIEVLQSVRINGCTQWLSIRGRDRRNPVLLYIHGGPGSPTMPGAWTFQSPWEDYFTVVQWDQRGAGKTYASNDPKSIAPTMTADQMIADTEQVVKYLMERLNKKKIFALGHSWGSYLGLELVRRHPNWLHAYIGTGQMIDSRRSESEGYLFALGQARMNGNAEAVRELETLAPYPGPIGALTVERISAQRKWVVYYGGLAYHRTTFGFEAGAWEFSPDYTDEDLNLVAEGSLFSLSHLLGVAERIDFYSLKNVECPLFIFQGEHDYETSYSVVREWFSGLRAPQKGLVTLVNSAHMGMLEEPGEYLRHLVSIVRPIAVEQGDAAPPSVSIARA